MDSPLKYDQAIIKEFGVTDDLNVEPEQMLGWVRVQFDEIKKFMIRERVDLILSEAQAHSDIEALAAQARTKVAEHRSNIKNVVISLKALAKLRDELEAAIKG
jgi:hypothetical protein